MEENTENIVAPTVDNVQTPAIDEAKVKLAADNLESFKTDLTTKLYAMQADDSLVKEFIQFIENEAEWKSMESLGIEELHKVFTEITGVKNGVIYLKNLEVEALHYFLSKVEGKGKESASRYLRMIRSVNDALKMAQADNRRQLQLEHELAAAQQGLNLEPVKKETE